MDRKEQLRQSIVGDYRDREWTYKKAHDHESNSNEFRRRMEMRRKLIPVTTYTVVQPTEK
jgi:hypothetical protein